MKYIQILLLLIFASSVFSQEEEKTKSFFVELNAARYAEIQGLFENYDYEHELDFLNGFKVGITKNNQTELYASFMIYSSSLSASFGFTGADYSSKSYQFGFGYNKMLVQKNRFSAQVGGELLFQFTNYDGVYVTDYGPVDTLSDLYTPRVGIASIAQINYRISERFSISANTRAGMYYRFEASSTRFRSDSFFSVLFEPINSLSLRVRL